MKRGFQFILGSLRSTRLELWLIVIAALAVAGASLFTYWNIVEDRELTQATLFKVADSLAATIEEHMNETVRDAHNAAYSAAVLIENLGGFGAIDAAHLHRELNRELVDNASITRLIAADASGRVIASSAEHPLPALSIANLENFRWHAANPAETGLRFGVSRKSPVDGKSTIPYSRAIRVNGALLGVVVAELNIDHMRRFYKKLTSSFPATIAVFNRDGIGLTGFGFPDNERIAGSRIAAQVPLDKLFQGNGSLEFTPALTGRATLFSYHVLQPHLILIAVGFDKETAMASWAKRSRQRAAVVGTGSVMFLALVGLLVIYLRRLQRSEGRLRASEAQLRAVADNLPNGMVYQIVREHDGTRRCVYASAGVERLNGLLAKSMLGDLSVFTRQVVEEDQPKLRAAQDASFATMTVFNVVVRIHRTDGELRWMHYCSAPRLLPDGRVLWDGLEIDITDLKQAEDALHVRQAKIASIFRSAPVGIGEIVDRVFTVVNDHFCEILGYSAEELLGRSTRMLYLSDAEWEEVGRKYDERGRGSGLAAHEARYRRKDGRVIDVLVGASSIIPGDRNAGLTFTVMDITEAKAARQGLEDAYGKLRALSGMLLNAQETERRNISSELHDEIGQALTTLKIKLHRLGTRMTNASATPADVASCMEIADIALGQVRDLSVNMRPPQLDLMGLEAALQWLLERHAEPASLKVHFNARLESGASTPQAEITCFRVVQEALTNAVRHAHAKNLWVDVADSRDEIELSFRDDGMGFDTDAAKARAARGGSIGLLSMEERVTLQGGSFELVSRPGAGTEIRARIPLAFRTDAPSAAAGGAE